MHFSGDPDGPYLQMTSSSRVTAAMTEYSKGWVIDGNYSALGTLISDHATGVICTSFDLSTPMSVYILLIYVRLDPGPSMVLRIFWRTLLCLLKIAPPCAERCNRTLGRAPSAESIIWWCISHHGHCERKFGEILAATSIKKGGNMRRLNEREGDLTTWEAGLDEMLRMH
ncbi:uncharacterized protein EDB91DRAFT_803346 [Suillus paluster]|uniref:uncharacterized protein n=1 Tax=Suillus paluster TaxID=48578 RepID=UPI001B879EC5|nr:uncharacterized protein EDB91DRAFT_803346 [Suillus paluster]KAG1729851.1 hypothetical protein EDB91DRAFT_803346 [Suillus paluster]